MPEAILACSANLGATRFDRFDSLLGSVGTRCTCHRVPPCKAASGIFSPAPKLLDARPVIGKLPETCSGGGGPVPRFLLQRRGLL
eukprot:11331878-Alexandrium_andersonii.AAC.1